MAEGDIPSEAELAAAIERLDTAIAKQKELLELRLQDAKVVGDLNEQLRIQAGLIEQDLTLQSQKIDKAKGETEIEEALTAQLREQIALMEITDNTNFTANQKKEIALKLLAQQRAQQELIKDASSETESFIGGIAGKLGIAQKFGKTAAGKFALMVDNLKQSGMAGEILNASLKTTFSNANVAASIISKMAESVLAVALALDVANSKFQRTTGFAGDFRGVMTDIGRAGLISGVSIEDAGAAMGSLVNNFSAFNPAATETNARLGETAALLAKTGVAADVSAGTMDFFTRAMGMSATASADLTRELALAGTGIGITTNKMLSDFQKFNGYLIGFGDRSTDVFKNLQAQAKATGIAIDSLVGIAQKFDAFDTAAQSAGQLNAVLGTNLSTVDLLNATTDQRLSMLAQEIQMATGGFKNLDRYTQMYVAQSIGAKDAAEAERLLNIARNPAELAKYNSEMQASAMRQDQLRDLTARMVPLMEQLKIAVMGLGLALEPLVVGLGFVIQVIGRAIQNFVSIINYSDATRVAFTLLGLALAAFLLHGPVVTMFMLLAKGIMAVGLSSKLAATGGILGLLLLLYSLYEVLSMQINPVFVAAFHFMAAGVVALGRAFNTIKGQAVIGGLVIAAVAASAALLVYAVGDLMSLLINNLSVLPEFAAKLIMVGGAFSYFGAGVLLGATALGMAVPMLLIAAPVLGLIAVSAMAIGIGFNMMGEGILKMGSGLSTVIAGLSAIDSLTGDDGFLAITTDGGKTSMVSANGAGVLTSFSSENITVDVKIPEIKVPAPIVHVYIDGREVRKMVRTEMAKVGGG
jgi:hypothetical protein